MDLFFFESVGDLFFFFYKDTKNKKQNKNHIVLHYNKNKFFFIKEFSSHVC